MSDAKGNQGGASDKKKSQQKKQGKSGNDGFTSGLQFWVIFLVAFVLLRFPLALSIVFGAIAGLAGGFCVGWWQDEKQLKGQEKEIAIKNPAALAGMDVDILLNPNEDFSEEYVDSRQQRRSRYVSNRPYSIEDRRRALNSIFPWRRSSSRTRN